MIGMNTMQAGKQVAMQATVKQEIMEKKNRLNLIFNLFFIFNYLNLPDYQVKQLSVHQLFFYYKNLIYYSQQ